MSSGSVLRTEGLGFSYGDRWVLKDLNLELRPGITGLLGPNGAGKTTLMRLALGLLAPGAGSVELLGGDPARDPALRSRAGYLPQAFHPPGNGRVIDYLRYLALLSGVPAGQVHSGVNAALQRVGLADRARSRMGSLSGGMLRRVGVAQAVVHDPQVLIADEPAVGLDPAERMRLFTGFRAMALERPTLISSHSVDEIEREADRVWFLREGRVVWAGTVTDAIRAMRGRVREGELPTGVEPIGTIVSRKASTDGNTWRVIGTDERLTLAEPGLLDAYFEHVGGVAA